LLLSLFHGNPPDLQRKSVHGEARKDKARSG
jgi:hypothetical protein